ncbi:MAG: nucleotidyltransferase family protein, partial [Clostridiales bacterium]|nr:nucleotidyltransferase family protein [Clostridiales bacterium]
MKAIILSGGQGTRLYPVTTELPKPMIPLLGRPLLEHILLLLRRSGVTEAAVTLHCMPEAIRAWFGDGSDWGMRLTYFTEDAPLGTAGSVGACREFLEGEEDFLVLPGDCVCDFDLSSVIAAHRQAGAVATLLLHKAANPLEYGLVHTDEAGRVLRFVEKPGWSQVFTNKVNTGIYLFR